MIISAEHWFGAGRVIISFMTMAALPKMGGACNVHNAYEFLVRFRNLLR